MTSTESRNNKLVKKLGSYCLEREGELVSDCHRVKKYIDPIFSKSEIIWA